MRLAWSVVRWPHQVMSILVTVTQIKGESGSSLQYLILWISGTAILTLSCNYHLLRARTANCQIPVESWETKTDFWGKHDQRPKIHSLILCFEGEECLVFLSLWSDSTICLSWGRCYVDCYPLYIDISTDCENQVSKYLVTDYRQLKQARPCGLWLWFWCHARYWTTVHYYSILFYTIYITALYYVPQMVGSAEGEMLEKNLIRNISSPLRLWLAVSYAGSSVFCFVVYKIHSNASKVYWLMLMLN